MLNTIEMWERLAYYNLRVMAPVYIMQADTGGTLQLGATQKGTIYAWWAIFQSLLPIVTGGFADRYGYKKVLGFSIFTMMIGYICIALLRKVPPAGADEATIKAIADYNYWALFGSIMLFATGTAFFKPSIQGSLAATMTKETSSVGWGIFYWVVNIGAFIGHFLPGILLGQSPDPESWRNLFLCSAAFTSLNLVMLFTIKDQPSGADKNESIGTVLKRTFVNILEPRLVAWLVIMSGFWLMMYQLWDLQPNFIKDWIDTSPAVEHLRGILPETMFKQWTEESPRGLQVRQEILLAVNSMCIIIGVVGMSWLTRHMRSLTAMLWGTGFAIAGILVAGLTMNVWYLVLGIVCFSLGEMTTGPKKSEYLAQIAPPGKKGLYLGYVNVPVGVGVFVGSKIAGYIYGTYGEKATLALRYIKENGLAPVTPPAPEVLSKYGTELEAQLQIARPDALKTLMDIKGIDAVQATQLLWDTYSPQYYVWLPFAAVGVVSALGLAVFGQMAKRWKDMDA
ncbi:MAG TPA: MFS transporter [Phycisphaerales bacterium]|nr:MFS transporter [Phycisphaerales bacterium]